MDGLLLDTERLALATFRDACRVQGFEPDESVYLRCIGTRGERTREILIEGYGEEFPIDAVSAEWTERYHEHVMNRPVEIKPGAFRLLERLAELALPLALATSTGSDVARRKLELAGLARFFVHVVGGDQVTYAKPHPEPYLEAIRRLGVAPQHTWAIEDSEHGVRSAAAAGLYVVQVPDLITPSADLRALGHPIVSSLAEVERMVNCITDPELPSSAAI